MSSAHIHIPRNNPAKFHHNRMDSLGVTDNRFQTDGRIDRRKDKVNLLCPASLKWQSKIIYHYDIQGISRKWTQSDLSQKESNL